MKLIGWKFANESYEKQFRVVAFSWWEGPMKKQEHSPVKEHPWLF
jgi:hypothetical protein